MKWPASSQEGLTLVELMVAMVLSLVLMAAVYMAYQVQHKSTGEQVKTAAAQQDLRAAMNVIGTDFRLAGMAAFGRSNTGIITANNATGHKKAGDNDDPHHFITLSYDNNADLDERTPDVSQVRYVLSGRDPVGGAIRNYTLMREETRGGKTEVGALVYNVSTFHLEYRRNNAAADTPGEGHNGVADDIDAIELTLTVWANTSGISGRTERRLVRTISCRNMR